MGDDLAVARGEKGVPVATQFDRADDADDLVERDVAADDGRLTVVLEGSRHSDAGFLVLAKRYGVVTTVVFSPLASWYHRREVGS